MSAREYAFRREDTGEVVTVDWRTMIFQDSAGYITLSDGVLAKRCLHLEHHEQRKKANKPTPGTRAIESESLGFPQQALADMEAHRKANGFTGVEFVPDSGEPHFLNVRFSSKAERDRYIKARGYVNRTGIGGVMLTDQELAAAEERVRRRYPVSDNSSNA